MSWLLLTFILLVSWFIVSSADQYTYTKQARFYLTVRILFIAIVCSIMGLLIGG